jgi:hypothetical protein
LLIRSLGPRKTCYRCWGFRAAEIPFVTPKGETK